MDDLRTGRGVARRYRNRRIGEFLKELELSEGRGTGIPKILESMRANGSEEPAFETDAQRTSFLVRLPLRTAPKVVIHANVSESATLVDTVTAKTVEPRVVGRMTVSQVRRILTVCQEPRRPVDLQDLLRLKDRVTLLYGYLYPLMEQDWLVRTQPFSPNSPTQRYVTTPTGKNWLIAHPVPAA